MTSVSGGLMFCGFFVCYLLLLLNLIFAGIVQSMLMKHI